MNSRSSNQRRTPTIKPSRDGALPLLPLVHFDFGTSAECAIAAAGAFMSQDRNEPIPEDRAPHRQCLDMAHPCHCTFDRFSSWTGPSVRDRFPPNRAPTAPLFFRSFAPQPRRATSAAKPPERCIIATSAGLGDRSGLNSPFPLLTP
jgi:hypothetical protein